MGSLIYIDPDRTPAIGDVVTFDQGNRLWTHRIIARTHSLASFDELRWQTQGHAVPKPDPFVIEPAAIRGVAVGSLPLAGYAALFLQQPPPWLFLGLLATFLLYASNPVEPRRQGTPEFVQPFYHRYRPTP